MLETDRQPLRLPIEQLRTALFESSTLLDFLNYMIDVMRAIKGIKAKLAQAAQCQASYFSQVLAGKATLSNEQLYGISCFLNLRQEEWDYFRELGILERSGSEDIKNDCKRRLLQLKAQGRPTPPSTPATLNAEDLIWYVSSWQHSAVVAAVDSPKLRTPIALSLALRIPLKRVQDLITQMLQRKILAMDEKGQLKCNLPAKFYLGPESAGQVFRMGWIQHGCSRALEGYREGFQRGGVFRTSRQELDQLIEEVSMVHRKFFTREKTNAQDQDVLGYFGIELFEV